MRISTFLILIVGAIPVACLADEPIYGVITSRIEAHSIKNERVTLVPGEVVEMLSAKTNGFLQAKSVSVYSEYIVDVRKDKVAFKADFLEAKEWKGQRKFDYNNEVSEICTTTFHSDGTFSSHYEGDDGSSSSTKGKLLSFGDVVWAAGACNSNAHTFGRLSVFRLKKSGKLCQVDLDHGKNTSACYESYGR